MGACGAGRRRRRAGLTFGGLLVGFLAGSFLPGARGRLVSGSSPSAAWSISASLLKPSTPPSPTKHSKCSFGRERQGGNRLDRVGFLALHDRRNHLGHLLDRHRPSAQGHLVSQRGAVAPQLHVGQVAPDGKQRLFSRDGPSDQAVEFVVGPALREELLREHHHAKAARPDALVNLAAQAVPDPQFGLVARPSPPRQCLEGAQQPGPPHSRFKPHLPKGGRRCCSRWAYTGRYGGQVAGGFVHDRPRRRPRGMAGRHQLSGPGRPHRSSAFHRRLPQIAPRELKTRTGARR